MMSQQLINWEGSGLKALSIAGARRGPSPPRLLVSLFRIEGDQPFPFAGCDGIVFVFFAVVCAGLGANALSLLLSFFVQSRSFVRTCTAHKTTQEPDACIGKPV